MKTNSTGRISNKICFPHSILRIVNNCNTIPGNLVLKACRSIIAGLLLLFAVNNDMAAQPAECGCSNHDIIGSDVNSESYISLETLTPGYCLDVKGTLYIDVKTEWSGITVLMRPGSRIVVEADFDVINGSHLKNCGDMWLGIQTTSTGKLTLTDCVIEGAEYGVKLVNEQEFKCRDVEFIDDYIGIAAGTPFVENETIKVAVEGEITGCKFYTDGDLPDPYSLYGGEWPNPDEGILYDKMYAALFMRNCINLALGSRDATGSDWNEVYETRNGVVMVNSYSHVVKTEFHDFAGQVPGPGVHDPGLHTLNQNAIYAERTSVDIQWNDINDVMVGIWGIEATGLLTKNEIHIYNGNGILAGTRGILQDRSQGITILDNEIYNGFIGIWMNNGSRPFVIEENYLERMVDRVNNEGIRVDGAQILHFTGTIYDNTISFDNSEGSVGISLQSVTGIVVDQNEITFDATVSPGEMNAGISLFDGTSCVLTKNVIWADADYNNEEIDYELMDAGIVFVNSYFTNLHCNDVENFDDNILSAGSNFPTRLSASLINSGNRGLEVLGPANLGIQVHLGNQWFDSFDEYAAVITGPDQANSALLSRFVIDRFDAASLYPVPHAPLGWFTHQSGEAFTCVPNTNQLLPQGSILTDFIRTETEFERFDEEMEWLAYAGLYDILLKHDSLLAYYALDSFFDIHKVEELGELMTIRHNLGIIPDEQLTVKLRLEEKLHNLSNDIISIDSIVSLEPVDILDWIELRSLKGDTILDTLEVWLGILDTERGDFLTACEDALYDLSTITPRNDLEDYLKETLRMKLSLIVDGYISSGDSTTIIDMVELCPWLGGYAIGLDYDIFAEITDSMPGHIVYPCDLMELRSISTFADQIGTYINVFPNPVTNLLTIDSGTEIQEISLYDLSSKLILQTNPNVKKYTLNLSAIHDGLYLLSINLGKSQENFKILINP